MADPYIREIGRVRDLDDCTVIVGVDYGSVYLITAGVRRLTQAQAREFAQLFVSACWQAGRNAAQMAQETYEADGGDTMHEASDDKLSPVLMEAVSALFIAGVKTPEQYAALTEGHDKETAHGTVREP